MSLQFQKRTEINLNFQNLLMQRGQIFQLMCNLGGLGQRKQSLEALIIQKNINLKDMNSGFLTIQEFHQKIASGKIKKFNWGNLNVKLSKTVKDDLGCITIKVVYK